MVWPGKHTKSDMEAMAIEIVDLPMKNGDFPWLCKRLPGGKT